MWLGIVFDHLTPYARVLTAVAPFLGAIVVRLMLGKTRVTAMLLSVSIMWFLANVLMAPYSFGMRQDLVNLRRAVFR